MERADLLDSRPPRTDIGREQARHPAAPGGSFLMSKRAQRRADPIRLKLEQQIVTGELEPGARLDEQTLADAFEVSRTPVREALTQLASIGLVEMRPRQGAIVAVLSL